MQVTLHLNHAVNAAIDYLSIRIEQDSELLEDIDKDFVLLRFALFPILFAYRLLNSSRSHR